MTADDSRTGSRARQAPARSGNGTQDRQARLLGEARDGRRDSLNQLVEELTPLLWHVVRAQGLDHDLAEDVIQTTWLCLLGNLDTIEHPRALARWLVTVAKREAWRVSNAARVAEPWDEQLADAIPDQAPMPEERLIAQERHRLLWTAFSRLERHCQRLLRMVAFTGPTSYAAVADTLGMRVGSIGPTRGRCLAKLRALLTSEPSWSRT